MTSLVGGADSGSPVTGPNISTSLGSDGADGAPLDLITAKFL